MLVVDLFQSKHTTLLCTILGKKNKQKKLDIKRISAKLKKKKLALCLKVALQTMKKVLDFIYFPKGQRVIA